MKRVLLIISLHLFLFLIVFAYQAQAEEDNEWYVNDFSQLFWKFLENQPNVRKHTAWAYVKKTYG